MTWNVDDPRPEPLDQRVVALEASVADLHRRLAALETGAASAPAPTIDSRDPWSVPPWPEIVALLRNGNKIEAIKAYRAHTGLGLKEAKDVVDEVQRRML